MLHPLGLNKLASLVDFRGRWVILHAYIAGLQLGAKHLFEISPEGIAIGVGLDAHGGYDSAQAHGAQHGQHLRMSFRRRFRKRLLTRGPFRNLVICVVTSLSAAVNSMRVSRRNFLDISHLGRIKIPLTEN